MHLFRLTRIAFEFLRFTLGSATALAPGAAVALCISLERLGTTFIKVVQALCLHRHMVPDEYVAALQILARC